MTVREKEVIQKKDDKDPLYRLNWKVKCLLLFAVLLVIMSMISPFVFTRPSVNSDFDFSQTGQIGDTIGGLMNPFIALAGVIVTGLAFYIQYRANLQQRDLFQKQVIHQNEQNRIQQFESQFYEMLRLHRENINEMQIVGYHFEETGSGLKKYEKITEGRKLFVVMQTELDCILKLYIDGGKRRLTSESFQKCYKLFFSGLEWFEKKNPDEKLFVEQLKTIRDRHENPTTEIKTNEERKKVKDHEDVKLYFNYKPFSGHASRLGHYFRHLYLSVKSVANTEIINGYDEKMRYLKLLRAQLSNHEQILLFYNWLGGHGDNWENDTHPFFTEYCMIHNLWYDSLFNDSFISEKVNQLRTKKVHQRQGAMFEVDE